MFITQRDEMLGPRWIINFPTKQHWREHSQISWINDGLDDLVRVVREKGIRSIALPPLGCGNGGLSWEVVRQRVITTLSQLDGVSVTVFEPTLQYQNVQKRTGVQKLTPARALIAETVRRLALSRSMHQSPTRSICVLLRTVMGLIQTGYLTCLTGLMAVICTAINGWPMRNQWT
jgi:hypothetical protein